MQILANNEYQGPAETDTSVLVLANDINALEAKLDGVQRVDLHFPNFTDGRAFTQAYLLRRRLGFTGDIRATGDVLIDQLVQMQRTGFSSAVLRAAVNNVADKFYWRDVTPESDGYLYPGASRTFKVSAQFDF